MWNIIGHREATRALDAQAAGEGLPHALLITGPQGVGKEHLALEIAKAVNCTGEDPPDQTCVQCLQIAHGSHPDVITLERLDGKDSIAVEQGRELRESASLRAFQARTKVFIVSGAEALTAQAADALLKTLEEPQPGVLIVLTAIDADALPETVVSRCRTVTLHPVPAATISDALQRRGVEGERADTIARLSQGSVGWALRAMSDPKVDAQRVELLERFSHILDTSLDERLALAESLIGAKRNRESLRSSLETLALVFRDLLLLNAGLEARLVTSYARTALQRHADRLPPGEVHAMLRGVRTAMDRIDANVDGRLALEALLLALP